MNELKLIFKFCLQFLKSQRLGLFIFVDIFKKFQISESYLARKPKVVFIAGKTDVYVTIASSM